MRRIEWSESTLQEINEIVAYIARDNPRAATDVADRIDRTILALAATPVGRQGRVPGTYEKVVTGVPYILSYALEDLPHKRPVLRVLHIIHGAREWLEGEWPT